MFCWKCGTQIDDASLFCYKCGAKTSNKQNTESERSDYPSAKQENNNKENSLDRKALLIYLNDLRNLEYAKYGYESHWEKLNEESNNYTDDYVKHYKGDKSLGYEGLTFGYTPDGSIFLKGWKYPKENVLIPDRDSSAAYWYEPCWIMLGEDPYSYSNNYAWTHKDFNYCNSFLARREFKKKWVTFFEKCLKDFQERCESEYNCKKSHHLEIIDISNSISKEHAKTVELLTRSYELNLIPSPFRNIYGIHYLYDYMSSSNQSFESALLHCDLDQIKQKLTTIINQNTQIIINQSIIMSQNEELLAANKAYLQKLSAIEKNTADTANAANQASIYASIAATNTEACALISMAQYLKM